MLLSPPGLCNASSQKRVPAPPSTIEATPPAGLARFQRSAARTAGVMAAPYIVYQ